MNKQISKVPDMLTTILCMVCMTFVSEALDPNLFWYSTKKTPYDFSIPPYRNTSNVAPKNTDKHYYKEISLFQEVFKHFPNKSWLLRVCSTNLL